MALNIMLSALIFMLIFIGIIKLHGEKPPRYSIRAIEVIGASASFLVFVVSFLVAVWS